MIRVGLAQYQPAASSGANLNLIGRTIERAGQDNVDMICFGRDFLGSATTEEPTALGRLVNLAKEAGVEILTGRIRLKKELPAQAVLIDRHGIVIDAVVAGDVKPIRTCLGSTLVLSEDQAYSETVDMLVSQLRPEIMVMQANAISLLELEAIKELAISRSFSQAHLVMCVSAVGRCGEEHCLGAVTVVLQGQIVAEADTGASELVVFTVDPAKFVDYDMLRGSAVIPELLKQKYAPHINHDTDSP